MFKSKYFELGEMAMTYGVASALAESNQFAKELIAAIEKFCLMDWGELCVEDRYLNYKAVIEGNNRIFAAYQTCAGKIYIVTEWDRTATTVLFANEY